MEASAGCWALMPAYSGALRLPLALTDDRCNSWRVRVLHMQCRMLNHQLATATAAHFRAEMPSPLTRNILANQRCKLLAACLRFCDRETASHRPPPDTENCLCRWLQDAQRSLVVKALRSRTFSIA